MTQKVPPVQSWFCSCRLNNRGTHERITPGSPLTAFIAFYWTGSLTHNSWTD